MYVTLSTNAESTEHEHIDFYMNLNMCYKKYSFTSIISLLHIYHRSHFYLSRHLCHRHLSCNSYPLSTRHHVNTPNIFLSLYASLCRFKGDRCLTTIEAPRCNFVILLPSNIVLCVLVWQSQSCNLSRKFVSSKFLLRIPIRVCHLCFA